VKKKVGAAAATKGKVPLARSGSIPKRPGSAASSANGVARAKSSLSNAASVPSVPSQYCIESLPLTLPSITPSLDAADPKLGVGLVSWSHDERFLLTRNDNSPSALWVWDTQRLALSAIVVQLDAVRCAAWDPKRLRFAACTNNSKLYLWSPEGCSIVDVPLAAGQIFQVRRIEWNREGNCILLMDKQKFCCCYMRE
jgi:WD40 repeat protein